MDKNNLWTTRFYYAAGTPEQMRTGEAQQKWLRRGRTIPASQLNQSGVIYVPRVIGVYQYRAKRSRKFEDEGLNSLESQTCDYMLSHVHHREDTVHPNLFHIVHDPSHTSRGVVQELLADNNGRVAISDVGHVPDFFEKDIASLDNVSTKCCMGLYGVKTQEELSKNRKDLLTIIDELGGREELGERTTEITFNQYGEVERAIKSMKPFGLTRNEYMLHLNFRLPMRDKMHVLN